MSVPIGPRSPALSVPMTNPVWASGPTMTAYTPATTSYARVVPSAGVALIEMRPNVGTENLQVASRVTHKIADATTLTQVHPSTTQAQDFALANELKGDHNTHVASTTYHVAAGTAITTPDADTDPKLIALANALRTAMAQHYASTTEHGGLADAVNLAVVTGTTIATDAASARTLLNALYPAHEAHLLVTDQNQFLIYSAATMPALWRCAAPFFAKTDVSGHTFAVAEYLS